MDYYMEKQPANMQMEQQLLRNINMEVQTVAEFLKY